jgi:hypothetical protein
MSETSAPNRVPASAPAQPLSQDTTEQPKGYARPSILYRTQLEAVADVCSGPGAKVRGICALENS